jgi:hypothetical protein
MKLKLLPLCFLLVFFSCANQTSDENIDGRITFADLVELENLNKVKMSNNAGTFDLNSVQIERIKTDLSGLIYDPNISVKVGAINIELLIDGKSYNISSATHEEYIEVHRDIVAKNQKSIGTSDWLYFKTEGVNFDDYKEANNYITTSE